MRSKSKPLSQHPVLQTQNLRKAEEFIEKNLRATIRALPKPDGHLSLTANRYSLTNSEIWFCAYGTVVSLDFHEGDYFRIQFHHAGQGATTIGKKEYAIAAHQSVISSAAAKITFGETFQQTVLRISKASITHKMATLIGDPIYRPLQFEEIFDPRSTKSQILKANFDNLVQNLNAFAAVMPPTILLELEQVLITSLLNCCPNNYSHIFEKQSAAAAPWQVTRAENYIEENWNQPLMLEDITAVTNCSARSLFRAFQQNRGYSPMAYAKQVRLRHAHKILLSGAVTRVTDVAHMCGFSDHGRFARDYVRVFGELPFQTLRRSANWT